MAEIRKQALLRMLSEEIEPDQFPVDFSTRQIMLMHLVEQCCRPKSAPPKEIA
jgi:hypothetical protein